MDHLIFFVGDWLDCWKPWKHKEKGISSKKNRLKNKYVLWNFELLRIWLFMFFEHNNIIIQSFQMFMRDLTSNKRKGLQFLLRFKQIIRMHMMNYGQSGSELKYNSLLYTSFLNFYNVDYKKILKNEIKISGERFIDV